MTDETIEVGDLVKVDFNTAQKTLCHVATVKHKPAATGDSWIFKDYHTQELHYVSEGCTLTLVQKKRDREGRG